MKEKLREYVRKNPRVWLLMYIPVYLIWFVIVERLVVDDYYVSWMPLDDRIPFVPWFAAFYVIWYPYLLIPIFYLYFKDARAFVRHGAYLAISLSICLATFMVFPNGQDLRPEDTGGGLWGWVLDMLYAADTNTNVLPSMHVVTCIGTSIAAFDSERIRKLRWPTLVLGVLISASTVLIKQHSFLDVIWAAVLGAAVALCVYALPLIIKNGTRRRRKPSQHVHPMSLEEFLR